MCIKIQFTKTDTYAIGAYMYKWFFKKNYMNEPIKTNFKQVQCV
jgi:hypothetical protein